MKVFLKTNKAYSTQSILKNSIINVIDVDYILNQDLSTFFLDSSFRNFIIHINVAESNDLQLELDKIVFILFHKQYYYFNEAPVFLVSGDVGQNIYEDINRLLKLHGFISTIIISDIEKKIFAEVNMGTFLEEMKNEEHSFQLLNPRSVVICDSSQSLESLEQKQISLLNAHNGLTGYVNTFQLLNNEFESLIKENKWLKSQLNNHKSYLEVLKLRVSQGRFYNLYMSIISFINKFGPLRKIAKYIHSKIFKKR